MLLSNYSNTDNIRLYRLLCRYGKIHEIGTEITIPSFILFSFFLIFLVFQGLFMWLSPILSPILYISFMTFHELMQKPFYPYNWKTYLSRFSLSLRSSDYINLMWFLLSYVPSFGIAFYNSLHTLLMHFPEIVLQMVLFLFLVLGSFHF